MATRTQGTILKQITVYPSHERFLRREAKRTGLAVSEIVRDALELWSSEPTGARPSAKDKGKKRRKPRVKKEEQ